MIRVRFAPSPTGPMSVGNVRTALYNWLYARHEGGEFLLRIEDTDTERSEKRYEEEILDGLKWLGLDWDGAIIRQSERLPVYERHLKTLVEKNYAYPCFCSKETLDAEYQAQLSQGLVPVYAGRCRDLPAAEARRRAETGEQFVIRLRMPSGPIPFKDLIRGQVSFDGSAFGDIIIAKGFRAPLYNFAVVVDDHESGITTVIRGEDHISNTPKQIAIHQALELRSPAYAHLPLILGPDRKKLSKRFLTGSLADYRRAGYLSEAMRNFLALLGWHPTHDQEVLEIEQIIKEFTLARVQKGGAVFDPTKLDWMNGAYIRSLSADTLAECLEPFVPSEWLADRAFFKRVATLERDRLKKLGEFADRAAFYFALPPYDASLLVWKGMPPSAVNDNLAAVRAALETVPDEAFSAAAVSEALVPITASRGRGEVLWPFRVALSGHESSPGPTELAETFGKHESLRRVAVAVEKFSASPTERKSRA